MNNPSAKAIFITGNSRSGTTMMGRILGNHPNVFTFQEIHFFDEIIDHSKANDPISDKKSVSLAAKLFSISRNGYFGSRNIEPFRLEATGMIKNAKQNSPVEIYKDFLFYESLLNKKQIPCEQTPQNIFFIAELLKIIPECRIIIMVRDPRAVLLSQKNKWKRRSLSGGAIPFWESVRSRINYHPITISKIWKSVMTTASKYKNHPRITFIKYEDLIASPEKTINSICDIVGIEYKNSMLNIPVKGSSNSSDSNNQSGIDSSNKEKWKTGGLNKTEISICESINRNLLEEYNYPVEKSNVNIILKLMYQISLPFQLILSLLFNFKRLKNPMKLFKRFFN